MDIYKVNGITIDKDTYKSKIIDTLDVAKFATVEQLSFILKGRQQDIKKLIQDIIIWYVKGHPNVSYKEICIDLNVRVEYIDELVMEGRLEDINDPTNSKKEILALQKSTSEITNGLVKDLKRREAINGLSKSLDMPNGDLHQLKKNNKFYTHPTDYGRNKW